MQSYSIGLSGLNAAQTAMDIIGNNIANAATEGYHRQRVELAPRPHGQIEGVAAGVGTDVAGVTRMVDEFLEREIVRQESAYGQISQELAVLSSVETSFGEFVETGGLNAAMDAFFDALRSLAAHPLDTAGQNEVVSSAETLTGEFRRLGTFLIDLEDQIRVDAQNTADSVNGLTAQIAELNGKIQSMEIAGLQANNLCDQRDRLIENLAGLAGLELQTREHGVVDVSIAGLPVVAGMATAALAAGLREDRSLGISVAGAENYSLDVQGGRLGALLTLENDLLEGLGTDLDALAQEIIRQVNAVHVQGLGTEGSFRELTGWVMDTTDLSAVDAVVDGTFCVRLTDTATGQAQRHAIDVSVSGVPPDTLASVAAQIDDIAGLSASVASSKLHIVADPGYTFDFLPTVLPHPTVTNLTATLPPAIAVSGLYTGPANDTFTFTAVGSGSIGNGNLQLRVTDANGGLVCTLNVGAGYAAADPIVLPNGIRISLGAGDLHDGDHFEIEAFAAADTSGFLAAAGMNTFFSGTRASEMRVCRDVAESPGRIATAFGRDLTDNMGALQLASVRDQVLENLNGLTPGQYYHRIAAGLGQQISLKQSRQQNIEAVVQNLEKRRSEVSDVNINDEAAQLLIFEKMFQAMGKYLGSIQTMMTTLMDMVGP